MAQTHAARVSTQPDQVIPWYIIGGLSALLLAAYWNTIAGPINSLVQSWMTPQYSHGFLIPLFAAVLIAMRRSRSNTSSHQSAGGVWE